MTYSSSTTQQYTNKENIHSGNMNLEHSNMSEHLKEHYDPARGATPERPSVSHLNLDEIDEEDWDFDEYQQYYDSQRPASSSGAHTLSKKKLCRATSARSAMQYATNSTIHSQHRHSLASTARSSRNLRKSVSTPAIYSLTSVAPYNGSFHQYSTRYKVQQSSGYGRNPDWRPYNSARVQIHNDPLPDFDKHVKPTYSRKVTPRQNESRVSIENNPIPNYDKKIKSVYDGTHIMSMPKKSKVRIQDEPIPDYKHRIRPTVPSHVTTHKPRTSFDGIKEQRLSLDHVKPTVPRHVVKHKPRKSKVRILDDKTFVKKMQEVPPTVPSHVVKHKPKKSAVQLVMDHCYRDELDIYRGVERLVE